MFNIRTFPVFKFVPLLPGSCFSEPVGREVSYPRARAERASGFSTQERGLGEVLECEGNRGRRKK